MPLKYDGECLDVGQEVATWFDPELNFERVKRVAAVKQDVNVDVDGSGLTLPGYFSNDIVC